MPDPTMAEALIRAQKARKMAMQTVNRQSQLPPLEEAPPAPQLPPEPMLPELPINEPAFLESYMGGEGAADPVQVDQMREMIQSVFPEAKYEGFKLPTGQAAERWVPQDYQDPGEVGQYTPIGEVMSRIEPSPIKRAIQSYLARKGGPEGLDPVGGDVFLHPQAGGSNQDSLRHGLLKLLGMKSRM